MGVERERFINIDRQPEREPPRPADAPVKKSISRLWPPPTDYLSAAASVSEPAPPPARARRERGDAAHHAAGR